MQYFKKNIILSPASYDGKPVEKGVLTLEKYNGQLKTNLKCYNIPNLAGKMILGVVFNDDIVTKLDVTNKNLSNLKLDLHNNLEENSKVSCVLLNINNDVSTPIIWGSTLTNKLWKKDTLDLFEEEVQLKQEPKKPKVEEEVLKSLKEEAEEDYITKETENFIDEQVALSEEAEYDPYTQQKEELMLHANTYTETHETFNPSIYKLDEHEMPEESEEMQYDYRDNYENFYEQVKEQIDELFDKYEEDAALEQIIPNSKFVKVDFGQNGDYYIFGLINDDMGRVEYIVYGMPAMYTNEPPEELDGYYQWLPLDIDKPEEEGFWLMYQDASSGENIKIQFKV